MLKRITAARITRRGLVPERLLAPLRVPSFRRLVAGRSVSFLGDWLLAAALVGWIYDRTGSTAYVAALMIVRLVPPIVGGGLAAAVVDRLPRERVLVQAELGRAAVVGGALAGVALGSELVVFAAAGLCGLLAPVGAAAANALVPTLVDDERLAGANAGLAMGQEIAMALGALAAGLSLSASTAAVALAADVAAFAVAAWLYHGIAVRSRERIRGRQRDGFRAGLRYLAGSPGLVVLFASFSISTLATGLINATLPRFFGELGLGSGGYGFGLAALATGLVVGEAAIGLVDGRATDRWLGVALAAMAMLFGGLALATSAPAALALLFFVGVANGVAEIVLITAVHREADPRFHGRVFGLSSAAFRTTMLAAVAAAPLVNAVASPPEAIGAAAACLLAAAGAVLAGAGRRARAGVRTAPAAA